jgi:hypothetical protein
LDKIISLCFCYGFNFEHIKFLQHIKFEVPYRAGNSHVGKGYENHGDSGLHGTDGPFLPKPTDPALSLALQKVPILVSPQ